MADQDLPDTEYTLSDGYVGEYNAYYDDSDGEVPLVIFMHGAGGDRNNAISRAQAVRAAGMFAVTRDMRGFGAGTDWITNNGFSGADYGWDYGGKRSLLDIKELIDHLKDTYSANIDTSRIALAGTSQGGTYCYYLAHLSDRNVGGVQWPKITAILPQSVAPGRANMELKYSMNREGKRTPGLTGRTWAIFENVSPIFKTDSRARQEYNILNFDEEAFYDLIEYGEGMSETGSRPVSRTSLRTPHAMDKDIKVFTAISYDDRWSFLNPTIDFMIDHPNSWAHFTNAAHHGSTDVDGEDAKINFKQLAFLKKFLLGQDTFGDEFSNSDPALADRVTMLLVPNNVADFQDETAAPYVDTNYSWVEVAVEKPEWLYLFGKEDFIGAEDQAQPTLLYLRDGTLSGAGAGGDGFATITQSWTTPTDAEDLKAAVEAGTSGSDIGSFISPRISAGTETYEFGWVGGSEAIYLGAATGIFHLSASKPGAQVYFKIQHTQDSGTTWVDVADTWYIFPDDYTADEILEVELEFTCRAMHLSGAAGGVTHQIRVVANTYSPHELAWVDGNEPIRFTPSFEDFSVKIYRGTTVPSRIVMPLHPDTVTRFHP